MLNLFLTAGPLLAVSAASGNLLQNPGFEEADAAKGRLGTGFLWDFAIDVGGGGGVWRRVEDE